LQAAKRLDKEASSMRKFMILASVVAIVVAALALPALAQHREDGGGFGSEDREDYYEEIWGAFEARYEDEEGWDEFEELYEDGFEKEGFFAFDDRLSNFYGFDGFDNDRWNDDEEDQDHRWDNDHDWWNDDRRDDDRNNNDDEVVVPAVSQEFDQEAQSGDVSQSFNVSNTGDNSNQCAGVQGVANTGNAQNQIGVLQYGSTADDFSFEDSGSSINVSPVNATQCDQAVNQAATAYGR
jgi:hypothetical protein